MEASDSSFKLQDRTAILTGPCTTYSQAIAMRLTQLGANVALVDRNIEKAERFATQLLDSREVHEKYGRAIAIQADLAKTHHVQDAISRAAEAFGGIDIYVDGLMTTHCVPFREATSLDDLDRLIDVNLRSVLLVTQAVMRFLESRRRGRIIYLMHDLLRLGMTGQSVMAATRGGVTYFAKSLAREAAPFHVTVNCIAMGVTEEFLLTQMGEVAANIPAAKSKLQLQFPQAQLTEPEQISGMVAFLASPMGASITGQTIAISNGLSL